MASGEADPELCDVPRIDLHSLRARDAALDSLCVEIQQAAAEDAAAAFRETDDMVALSDMCRKPVLITGAAGYLGATMHSALVQLGIAVVGVDVVKAPTVDEVADVADLAAMRRLGQSCDAVLHIAARHHPHASSWHERDFISTNVRGTENVLSLGLPVVHTSTTSLTITNRVKIREKSGELVWLDEMSQRPDQADEYDSVSDAPRNKYGRTKLAAEQRCLVAAKEGLDVCILRAPRFFPEEKAPRFFLGEEMTEDSDLKSENIKANELLGRRCALVDLIDAELRALARIRRLRGKLFTLASPWPLSRPPSTQQAAPSIDVPGWQSPAKEAAACLRATYPNAAELFARHGWQLPDAIPRIYDSAAASIALGWQPRFTFEAVLQTLQQASEGEDVQAGEHENKCQKIAGSRSISMRVLLRGAF